MVTPQWPYHEGTVLFYFETQAEMANLPNLPNSVKIKKPLNVSNFKIKIFISFVNVLNLYQEHFELKFRYLV